MANLESKFKTAPTDLNSAAAIEYNEYLKGKAAQGLLSPAELQWTKTYNTNRYEFLKGKATQGVKLTPKEQTESDFLINLGVNKSNYNPSLEVNTSDVISVLNRLDFLANKSRVGTPGIGPDAGKEFKGGLTPEENAEFDKLFAISEKLLKSKDTRPVYGIKNPDGTTTLSYTNPTAKEEEAYRQQYGANTSLAQAGTSPYGGGKVLNWEQKQQAMKRVEELRPNYATLPYSQQQEFDAIQRNLYASILVNKDNPNPPEANATSIYDNTPEVLKQYGFDKSLRGVQVGAAPGSMPGAQIPKTVVDQKTNTNGSTVVTYDDGTKTTTTANGIATTTDKNGNVVTDTPDVIAPSDSTVGMSDYELSRQDAFEGLKSLFTSYGLGSLADKITSYMKDNKGPNEAAMLIKQSEEYNKRFAGNVKRVASGLNAMDEASYIDLENAYGEVLKAYGLKNMLSFDAKKNEEMFATWIGNDINAPEFKSRVSLVVDRVQNADPALKETIKKFYPSLDQSDLVAYFLSPTENLPKLQEKVTAAEIGTAALSQGLATDVSTATGLAQYGVDRATALKGYANVAEILPESKKLSDIYGEAKIDYTQKTAEEEVFKGSADAASKRKRLASLERASFQGDSGVSSQTGSLAKNIQGTF
jgi:hypothetical protein